MFIGEGRHVSKLSTITTKHPLFCTIIFKFNAYIQTVEWKKTYISGSIIIWLHESFFLSYLYIIYNAFHTYGSKILY